ncbi:N-acyl-D-amino-acid deacylase family protein [Murimonas intestini]|uniref:N-acyl-D-amino-acid deacylase family protein n=1 Tax=Murimonas intestini TaxID=1337051 RepID=UPI0011DD9788|nr:amidohydrolase family protein [Murimonas intestini]
MRTLIRNGLVYDGSGNSPVLHDILIEGDRIQEVRKAGTASLEGDICVIDASGLAVTPGFIDSHRHCDAAAILDEGFGKAELAQGITTALAGNCGMSLYPSSDASRQEMYDFLEPCLGKIPAGLAAEDVDSYLEQLSRRPLRVNLGSLTGTGAVKIAVKGFSKSAFSKGELDRACALVRESLEGGAFGLSSGIMYVPECYSSHTEYIRLLKELQPYSRVLSCHIRGEGDSLVESVKEITGLAEEAGIPLNISHFKSVGCQNWGSQIYRAIEVIESSKADVTVDFYPYTGGSTTLMTLLPPEFVEEEMAGTLAKLETARGRDLLRHMLKEKTPGWDNMVQDIGWDRIIVSSAARPVNEKYTGRSIADNTQKYGFEDEVDFFAELLCGDGGKTGGILMSMDQRDVDTVASLPYSMVISDSLYGSASSPHPRLYGAFPRFIREYAVERKILSMETAVRKMTGQTADRFGIPRRGYIREGYFADINIFDPEKVKDGADYSRPVCLSSGMDYVFVNGKLAWEKTKAEGAAGRVLSPGK